MSKIKFLLDVVNDMRSLADGIEALANVMADGGNQPKELKPTLLLKTNAPAVTHEMFRKLAVKLSRGGRCEEVKELLGKYGVKNITAVADSDLDAFYADLQQMEGDADVTK